MTTLPTVPKPDFLPGPEEATSEAGGDAIQEYVLNQGIPDAINIGFGIIGIGAFIGVLVGAINILTAFGNDDKITKAKTIVRYSILGLVIVMLSYAMVSIIVSVALPTNEEASEEAAEETSLIFKTAYAVDTENDINILIPNENDFIEQHDAQNRVSLPDGDFINEIVPAIITNLFYFFGMLLFIAFMVGGVLLVIGRGNEEATTKAKNIMIYSLVALAIASFGYAIIYGILTLNLTNESGSQDDVYTDIDRSND